MPIRCPTSNRAIDARPRRATVAPLFALLLSASVAAAEPTPCWPQGVPVMELRVTPGEMAAPGKELRINVHDNDCVSIKMPDYYRRRGEYALALSGSERAELQSLLRDLAAQPYDHQLMLAEASRLEGARAVDQGHERFAVLDADHYVLTLRDGDRFAPSVRALAVFQYAERYPEIRSLDALQRLTARLISLSERDELSLLQQPSAAAEVSR